MSTAMKAMNLFFSGTLVACLAFASPLWAENAGTEGFAVEWQQRSNQSRNKAVRTLPPPASKTKYTSQITDEEPYKHLRLGAMVLTKSNAAGLGFNLGVAFSPRFGLDLQAGYTLTTNTTASPEITAGLAPSFFITDYVGFALGATYNISTGKIFINTDLMLDFGFFGAFIGLRSPLSPNEPGMFTIGVSTRL